jgi:hypothetical protein
LTDLDGLKRQSYEIFDLWFFHKSTTPKSLINTLKYFWILFRIRGASRHSSVTKFNSALYNIARSQIFSIYSTKFRTLFLLYNVWYSHMLHSAKSRLRTMQHSAESKYSRHFKVDLLCEFEKEVKNILRC